MITLALTFEAPEEAFWFVLVPVVLVVMITGTIVRRRALAKIFDAVMLGRLTGTGFPVLLPALRMACVTGAMALLVMAMMDPRRGEEVRTVMARGVDLMIVLDCSRSMLAEDAQPNRLERARRFAEELLDAAVGDRAGLITYAGTAALACPLTIDHGAVRLALREADPALMPRGGSLPGDALRLAGASFADDIPDHKVVVVLSDGDDHGSFPTEAATQLFRERGIPVFTVGIGDAGEGARIPADVDGQRRFLQHEGQEVWSVLDERMLRAVAEAGGGSYVPAGVLLADMGSFYTERIRRLARRDFEGGEIRRGLPRFRWFVLPALLLLLIEPLLRGRGEIAPLEVHA